MSNELVAQDLGIPTGVSLRDPEVILEEAGERAKALTKMVEATKSYTQIGPSKHLRVEAWITVGQFYGCSARTTHTEEISYNGVFGFKAHARVTHDASGQVLTEAEALCMQDEKNWDDKPLHQLMSMAQTRAISKALAMKFRWVVTLGGFAPTPAEEMTGLEGGHQDHKPAKAAPAPEMRYGKHKGKRIDNPDVPTEYLQWMADKTAQGLDNPDRAKYKAQDQLFLAALDAEIKARQAAEQPRKSTEPLAGDVQGLAASENTRKPFDDSSWVDFIALAEEDYADAYKQVKAAWGVQSGHDIKAEHRWRFYDAVEAETNK